MAPQFNNDLFMNIPKLQDVNLDDVQLQDIDPRVQQFSVSNPIKAGGHIKYSVNGVDSTGGFEESRRFREFYALKNALSSRWPGVYIPALPEKKLMGNNDDKFVEERRSLLERFMKELAKYDYLIHSQEFKTFARDRGDLEKILGSLTKQTPFQVLEKYRQNFNVEEDQPPSSLQKYKENILEFQTFLKKIIPVMEIQKRQLKRMIQVREAQNASYKAIYATLTKYEEANVEYYAESDVTKKAITNPAFDADIKEKAETAFKGWRNPFRDSYIWLKGELMDLKGLNEALLGRDQVVRMQSNSESKKRSDQNEMEKLS